MRISFKRVRYFLTNYGNKVMLRLRFIATKVLWNKISCFNFGNLIFVLSTLIT